MREKGGGVKVGDFDLRAAVADRRHFRMKPVARQKTPFYISFHVKSGMIMDKISFAEQKALEAAKLEHFAVQIHDVRRTTEQILNMFGRDGIFNEYTVHNFSHVEAMLEDLDWLITEPARSLMTLGDWLMITLAIYFHDMGLVVTQNEYENRDASGFKSFCETVLFAKSDGRDYEAKVRELGSDRAERFFYQEFVRANHANRVRAWIEGSHYKEYGFSQEQVAEITSLLSRLDPDFRRDLAIVCESHNIDDLDNLKKYKPFQPYGRNPQESVNLLFCAVILRSVDLLQFTQQRAPSVMFRMINPTDPVSQAEWIKQNAVRGIFPKPLTDKEGLVDPQLPTDTLAVYAKFTDQNGFFGITSYLSYAERQLRSDSESLRRGNATVGSRLHLQWRKIDTTDIEPVGFIPSTFQFSIDQAKILDLLTGHTLYNDSSVAVRELVQNSIDAVRLYFADKGLKSSEHGRIKVSWEDDAQRLTVLDNGTGMTQDIIENHLLSVGSSRYQDVKFKEKHPDFSSISRFGIGVLSTFMVADDVQIVTFHEDEAQGREITLRSVHGKYLVRLLDKHESPEAAQVGPHGTRITLRLRASARRRLDVLRTLRSWILFPRCKVEAEIVGEGVVPIGYNSPKEAIESFVDTNPNLGLKRDLVEVCEIESAGMTLAFALVYNRHFRDKTFVQVPESGPRTPDLPPVGICVEGIRVEFEPPGFSRGSGFLGISDFVGKSAPKTNVARSSLESYAEKAALSAQAFTAYIEQVQREIDRLQDTEKFSLNYAVSQFPYIVAPLTGRGSDSIARDKALLQFPQFLLEDEAGRRVVSASELLAMGGFWTVSSKSTKSLIELLKDTPANITCKQVAEFCQFKGESLPTMNMVTNAGASALNNKLVRTEFEISELKGFVEERRLDVFWKPKIKDNPAWFTTTDLIGESDLRDSEHLSTYSRYRESRRRSPWRNVVWFPQSNLKSSGLERYIAVSHLDDFYMLPGTPIAAFLQKLSWRDDAIAQLHFLLFIDSVFPASDKRSDVSTVFYISEIEYALKELIARFGDRTIDTQGFLEAVKASEPQLSVFDPWSWSRNEPQDPYDIYF